MVVFFYWFIYANHWTKIKITILGGKNFTHINPKINPDVINVIHKHEVFFHVYTSCIYLKNDINVPQSMLNELNSWPIFFKKCSTNKILKGTQWINFICINIHIHVTQRRARFLDLAFEFPKNIVVVTKYPRASLSMK